MSNFKVGDRVLLDNNEHGVVEEIGLFYPTPTTVPERIIRTSYPSGWRPASRFTLVPPEKPKYRLEHHEWNDGEGEVEAILDSPNLPYATNAPYGERRAAQTRKQAEVMVRAAMASLGYEEAS